MSIADLPALEVGMTTGSSIVIDLDAAGRGWFVDVSAADNVEFSLYIEAHAIGAAAGSVAYGKMDLVTVVTHEMGHVLGFDHADAGTYAVMREDLDPGVRYLLDELGFKGDPNVPIDDKTLLKLAMQAAEHEAWSKAGRNDLPSFDLNPSDASSGAAGRVDWNDRFRGGWGTYLSPFGSGAAKSAQNFTDFMAKMIGSSDDESGDDKNAARFDKGVQFDKGARFDKIGGALNSGSHTKPGKGAGR